MKAVCIKRGAISGGYIQSRLNIYDVLVYTYIETELKCFYALCSGITAKYTIPAY